MDNYVVEFWLDKNIIATVEQKAKDPQDAEIKAAMSLTLKTKKAYNDNRK